MRTYIAFMLVALIATGFYVAVTEGPIHDRAWESTCRALLRGEVVPNSDVDPDDLTINCRKYDNRPDDLKAYPH